MLRGERLSGGTLAAAWRCLLYTCRVTEHAAFLPPAADWRVKWDFTTQHVWLSLGVWCGAHTGEVQSVAQHGVHPAEDVRVAAGRQGRRLGVRAVRPAGIVSLQEETRKRGGIKSAFVLKEKLKARTRVATWNTLIKYFCWVILGRN